MIEEKSISLNYIKKADFPGSDAGIRYLLRKVSEGEETLLRVFVWPEPFSLVKTDPSLIRSKDFLLSEDGKKEAVTWINAQKKTDPERYGQTFMQAVGKIMEREK